MNMAQTRLRPSFFTFEVGLAVFYAVTIFVLGSLPSTPPAAREVNDKLQHALGFALLAWLWCRAIARVRPGSSLRFSGIGAFLVSVALGGALELWQGLLGYRSCELLDWVADGVGAAAGAVLHAGIDQWRASRARPAP
jgi:VanZ family protein